MRKNSFAQRGLSILLTLVMLFSLMPAVQIQSAPVVGTQIADHSTMDGWKDFFSPDNITTAHAGGVWTDKSVFKDSPFSNISVGQDNFLVALSAMGSNSVVVGQTYAPMDTMFVLDVSNSMSNNAFSNMVTATNNAIRTLLQGEDNKNRVGVVLYGTTASVLLPLDHYTGVSVNGVETFIELTNGAIRAARVRQQVGSTTPTAPDWWDEDLWGEFPPPWWDEDDGAQYETVYLKNSAGEDVTNSVSTGGGTYIQGGLWKAWQEFNAATVENSGAVRRSPVMVLMSDGAPTYTASDFDNVPNRSNWGTGSNSYNGDGFVTQLTSAYVKAKMAEKYGTTAYFYTLGLEVSDIAIAKAVLNPQEDQTAALAEYWEDYLALRNGSSLSVHMRNNNGSKYVDIDKVAEITTDDYVDRYFAATQISDLNRQFQNIVNEISLSAGYYPTHIDDNGSNYSGYITFVDELGPGMKVKALKGIVIGNRTYTGELLARSLVTGAMGTKEAPTAMGSAVVWSLMARLGLTDTAEVWGLLEYAYHVRKSLYFDEANGKWSNHIVWYGDANGDYLGYDESLEEIAAYRNVCYAMLGTADGTHQASDMMYVGVQVSTELATNNQTVTFRVPASMLPVVTYQINIDGDEVTENTTASLTYKPADPIRLVYEVGVRDDISDLDLIRYAKNVGGKYYLYTNNWNENPDLENVQNNDLSYAYFEPGADNEHYYFTDDAVIYSAMNTNSAVNANTALNAGGTYYYRHYIFKGNMSTKQVDAQTGNITVSAAPDFHFEELSDTAINIAINENSTADGLRVVPDGTIHYAHSHDLQKRENLTETYGNVRKQIVDAKVNRENGSASHYELAYLGNNGRLEVDPTQGILLSKRMTDNSAPTEPFTFDVKLQGVSNLTVKLVYVNADGVMADPVEKTVTGGALQVQLKAGEAVYIYNIPANTSYTVTEQESDAYHQAGSTGATGTVLDNAFSSVVFTNEKTAYSQLNVTKLVTYLKGASNANEANKPFTVTVTLTKNGAPYAGKNVYLNGAATPTVTNADGQITFRITDHDTVNITNIPVGVEYVVTESDLPTGYTWTNSGVAAELKGKVTVSGAHAVLKNTYAPEDLVVSNLAMSIRKNVVDATGTALDTSNWPDEAFVFIISRWNGNTWDEIAHESLRKRDWTGNFYLPKQTFPTAGTYYFRVEEIVGNHKGMTYDRAFRDFAVTVTDLDLDGALEISSVTSVQNAVVEASGSSWIVKTAFTNIYQVGSTKLTFKGMKTLTGRELKDGEFTFQVYETGSNFAVADGATPILTTRNGVKGDVVFEPIVYSGVTAAKDYYYVVKEVIPANAVNNKLAGVTYTEKEYKIKVTVEDDNGTLAVTAVTVNGETKQITDNVLSGMDFANTYRANSIRVPMKITKTLIGADKTAQRDFKFLMEQLNEAGQPIFTTTWPSQTNALVWNGNEGTIDISFGITSAGTLRYKFTEILPDGHVNGVYEGITYDPAEYIVEIVTTDNGDGTLSSVVTVNGVKTDHIHFTNVYSAAPATGIVLNGLKTLNAQAGTKRPMKAGEFSFTLTGNGVNETVFNKADGSFVFSALTFKEAGDYTFTITENNTHLGGVGYVQTPVTVTVNVRDNGEGQLVASIDGKPVAQYLASFVNTYSVQNGHLTLEGIKELNGAEGTDRPLQAGDFSFTLTDPNHSFTYISDPATGATAVANTLTAYNDGNGKIVFPTILYNAVGTHTYTVTENKLADGTDGITYDKVVYTITVEVTDNQSGMLVAKITKIEAKTGDDETQVKRVVDFFNSYRAEPAKVIIGGNKVLENVTPGISQNDKNIPLTGENLTKFPFSFQLEAVTQGAPMPEGAVDGKFTVSSGENGVITFPAITFDAVGEYSYTVKELIPVSSVAGVLNGVTYTVQTHEITVKVTDNKTGELEAQLLVGGVEKQLDASGKAVDALSFKNTYKAVPPATPSYPTPGSVAFGGNKKLENVTPGVAAGDQDMAVGKDQFVFQLWQGAQLLQTVATQEGGSFLFDALVFDTLGEYEYTIKEVDGGKDYITYAGSVTVKVTVTDVDLDGVMEIAVSYDGARELTVTNKYAAAGTKLQLTGKKDMDNRDPRAEEFSFKLSAVNNAPMPASAVNGVVTVKNDAAGVITFPEIAYDTVGVYHYTVEEVVGVDGTNGVTFDKTVYDVTVTVSDGGDGKLIAVAKSVKQGDTKDSQILFFNKYQAAPAEFTFSGTKVLNGRDLVDGEFTFLLKNEAGEVLQTVTNKDGKFAFAAEKLLSAGTYKFTIAEDASPKKEGITYDTTVHVITVVVKDDGMGQLKTYVGEEETNKASVSFTNTYKAPQSGSNEPPKTSDDSHLMGMAVAMLASAASLVVLVVSNKKRYAGHFTNN